MSNQTDHERAIYFEGRCHEANADLGWMREQLAEAHRIIGILIQSTAVGAGVVPSIHKLWPGRHPAGKTPGEKRLAEFKAAIGAGRTP